MGFLDDKVIIMTGAGSGSLDIRHHHLIQLDEKRYCVNNTAVFADSAEPQE